MLKIIKYRNNVIREKINIKNSVSDYLRYKQLNWYSYVRGMNVERLPQKKKLKWCPIGRRRRKGRLRNLWKQGITTGMRKKEINNMVRIDVKEWRRKIKL
jgi:hypothetical protein